MITILIRNSEGRTELLRRCLDSVSKQTIQPRIVISYDSKKTLEETIRAIESVKTTCTIKLIKVTPNKSKSFHWNLYCNALKKEVTEGWFLFLDSDDFIHTPSVLEMLSHELTDPKKSIICQFLRNGKPKPIKEYMGKLVRGKIGGSCIVSHHSQKDLAQWKSKKGADFDYISDMSKKVEFKWVELVVVEAGNKGLKGKKP